MTRIYKSLMTHLIRAGFLRSSCSRSQDAGRCVPISHPHNAVWDLPIPGLGQHQNLADTGEKKIHGLLDYDCIVLHIMCCGESAA